MFRLKYIEAGPLATPELATEQASNEIIHFAEISKRGLAYAREAINETNADKFEELRGKLVKYEEISDRIEYEIAQFLNAVSSDVFVVHLLKRQFCRSNKIAYRIVPVNQDCLVLFHVVTSFGLTA